MSFRHFSAMLLSLIPLHSLAESKTNASNKNAPWVKNAASNQFNPVYSQQWRKADNRKNCALLVLPRNASAHLPNAKSRPAPFSGGWAIAYDTPKQRSAYGVANAGTTSKRDLYEGWAYRKNYADGSYVTLGREGNNPQGKMLAYLVLNNGCFYNIWSQLSSEHLQKIIGQLRYVN